MNNFPVLKARGLAKGYLHLLLLAAFIFPALSSCKMINEDLDDCPHTFLVVNFEYKYHMSSEYVTTEDDWFGDHAGSAYLYVFDEDGYYLFRKEKNKAFLDQSNPDFSIMMDETEIQPGKTYILAAIAQGNHAGYEASLATPGFTLLHEMIPLQSKISDYRLKLDRDDDGYYDFGVVTEDYGVFNYKEDYANNKLKLDTLWSTRPGFIQTVKLPERDFSYGAARNNQLRDTTMYVTIPMMRITNSIKINLVYSGFTQDTNVDDYKFLIDFPNGNGTLGFTGDFDTDLCKELMYFTLRKQVKQYQRHGDYAQYDAESENDVVSDEMNGNTGNNEDSPSSRAGTRAASYCVNAEFGVSRLQVSDGSTLQIINATTGREIAKLENMSDWLADYFEHRYDDQEFLDREYDYTIDVQVDKDGNGTIVQAGCYILGWGKRIQDIDLGL